MTYGNEFNLTDGIVLCQIVEWGWDAFRVEIYGPDGGLVARSADRLTTEEAMNFIAQVAEEKNVVPRFQCGPPQRNEAGDAGRGYPQASKPVVPFRRDCRSPA